MTEIIIAVAAIVTAVTVIITAVIRIYKIAKRLDTAVGVDRNGKTATERVEEKVSDVSTRLSRVEYQLFPNGGGSMADKLSQVDRQVIELKAQSDIVLNLLNTLVDNHSMTVQPTLTSDQVAAPETKPRLRKSAPKSTVRK